MSEEKQNVCLGKKTHGGVQGGVGWEGEKALKRFFSPWGKTWKHKKTCCIVDAVCCKMLNLFFILMIMILHGKKRVAVNDISAFYLPHFTFFMSFKMFLARFACHTAKKKQKKKKKKWENKPKKKSWKKFWQWNKNSRFSRSLRFKPISAKQ